MAVKPILFNSEMVRAILEGRKTVTRRVVKGYVLNDAQWGYTAFTPKGYISCRGDNGDEYGEKFYKLPYQIGDILYVRETWNGLKTGNEKFGFHTVYWYKADDKENNPDDKWRPSIHMPKDAARIFLKVTDVSAERLQDITEQDVEAEGTDMDAWYEHDEWQHAVGDGCVNDGISVTFETLKGFFGHHHWDMTLDSLEKYEKYGWDANPWVWVIRFERCEKP